MDFGIILVILGGLGAFATGIWLLVLAFQRHILWGLAYLFVPFASLVFVVMTWNKAAKPFLISLACSAVMIGGMFTSPTVKQMVLEAEKQEQAQEQQQQQETAAPQ